MKTEKEISEEIASLLEERKEYKQHHSGMRRYIEYLGNRIVTLQWVLGVTETLGG